MGPTVTLTRMGPDLDAFGRYGSLAELVLTLDTGSPCFCCGSVLVLASATFDRTGAIARCPDCGAEVAITDEITHQRAA